MTTTTPAATTTVPAADPTPAPKVVKPIPPAKGAAPTATPERDAGGKFVAKDAATDPAGAVRDALGADPTSIAPIDDLASSLYESEEDRDRDRPVATLDGMISEEKGKTPKLKVKTRETIVQKALAKDAAGAAPDKKADIVDPSAEDNTDGGDAKAADATTPPAPVDPAAPKTEKFILATLIGDRVDEQFEFDTPEKAAQSFKTLRGMYKKENADRIALQANAKANFDAAEAWRKKAEALERGERTPVASTKPTPAGEAGGDAPLDPADAVAAAIDWNEYDRVESLANEKYPNNPRLVARLMKTWEARETAKAMQAQFDKRIDKYEAPTRERAALEKHGKEVSAKMDDLESASNEDGSLAYPEFADNEARVEIGRLLRLRAAEGLSWDYLKGDKGLYETVLVWRDWRRRTGRPWSANGADTVATPPPSSDPAPTDAAGVDSALRSLEGRNAGVMDGRRQPVRPAADSPAESIKRKIAESDQRTALGWSR